MSKPKVFIIEMDQSGSRQEAFAKRDTLGRAIIHIAMTASEPVFFHDYKGIVGANPILLLECSDAFLAQVKKFQSVGIVKELDPRIPSRPSPQLHRYFGSVPSQPRPPFAETKPGEKPKAPAKPKPRGPGL
jgi:hypothetical protein